MKILLAVCASLCLSLACIKTEIEPDTSIVSTGDENNLTVVKNVPLS